MKEKKNKSNNWIDALASLPHKTPSIEQEVVINILTTLKIHLEKFDYYNMHYCLGYIDSVLEELTYYKKKEQSNGSKRTTTAKRKDRKSKVGKSKS